MCLFLSNLLFIFAKRQIYWDDSSNFISRQSKKKYSIKTAAQQSLINEVANQSHVRLSEMKSWGRCLIMTKSKYVPNLWEPHFCKHILLTVRCFINILLCSIGHSCHNSYFQSSSNLREICPIKAPFDSSLKNLQRITSFMNIKYFQDIKSMFLVKHVWHNFLIISVVWGDWKFV